MRGERLFGPLEVFLFLIIVLNLLDFFEIIPSELDYAKKILSWSLLGYLLYRVSPTHVFFGHRSGDMDVLFIFSCFLLVIKNLISYAAVAAKDASAGLLPFYKLLIDHHAAYETTTFIIGVISLLAIALYAGFRTSFSRRSVMGVLHEEGSPSRSVKDVWRSVLVFLVFLAFFLFVFNMMMEWLAFAVDATILLAGLLVYSVLLVRRRLALRSFIKRVANTGNQFYTSFIDHFRFRESFLLGIVGLLVLHLLTDLGIFLVPYVTTLQDPLYFGLLGPGHGHVWSVLSSLPLSFPLLVVFAANIVAFVMLFVSPAIVWRRLYRHRVVSLPKAWLVVFFASLPAALLNPLFLLSRLAATNFVGVDVLTSPMGGPPFTFTLIVMALSGVLAWMLTRHATFSRLVGWSWLACSTVFFGRYALLFFLDVASYFQEVVFGFLSSGRYFLAVVFFCFQALTILFYSGGFVIYLIELFHHHRDVPR